MNKSRPESSRDLNPSQKPTVVGWVSHDGIQPTQKELFLKNIIKKVFGIDLLAFFENSINPAYSEVWVFKNAPFIK